MVPGSDPVELTRRVEKLSAILDVAKAMTVQRDLDRLLELILQAATRVVDADRSSIFIVDREKRQLWTKVAQGTGEIRIPLDTGIAGAVATTGKTVVIKDAYADPRFNRSVDLATGYHTRNILCVPMCGVTGDVTGVLQALNKARGDFTEEDEELLWALGGQAAASIENAILHEEISRLFEGFVGASVLAIESRDPTTAGHSSRVATLTVELASSLEHVHDGSYARVRFTREEINEIRYASLLHDFGKVGVREPVLVKAEKLYPYEIETLRYRFELVRARMETDSYKRRVDLLVQKGALEAAAALTAELEAFTKSAKDLDELFDFVMACNKPTVLPRGGFERLEEIRTRSFSDGRGGSQPLLTDREIKALAIPKGSLSDTERTEIESHVTWTYRFLSQIPWTRTLRSVPDIAYAHHEKLDGKGYPRKLQAQSIPVQSRMMAISDIFDALTASDRPYKKALPTELALDILKKEADLGQLDRALYDIFLGRRIWEKVIPKR
ncbi:MAG TPA: HD domain-containing phosphohydrolase [Myxococcales bacterium]|jgi:HD-GYP domain-containing protein (c-di-GMP phosphodiesterase class II)